MRRGGGSPEGQQGPELGGASGSEGWKGQVPVVSRGTGCASLQPITGTLDTGTLGSWSVKWEEETLPPLAQPGAGRSS